MGVVRIMTLTAPVKFVTLTTHCWACLMSVCDEINVAVEEIKRYNTGLYLYPQFPSDYSGHIGDYYYMMVAADYGRVSTNVFTIQMASLSMSCMLHPMESLFASISGHIC